MRRSMDLRRTPDLELESFHGQEVTLPRAWFFKELKGSNRVEAKKYPLCTRSQVMHCVGPVLWVRIPEPGHLSR